MKVFNRKSIVKIFAQVTGVALFGLSCTGVNSPVIEEPKEIMPLSAGNRWTYLSGPFSVPDTTILEITRQLPVTIDSVTYQASAYIYYVRGGTKPDFEWLYWHGDDGLYWLGGISAGDTLFNKILGFKYPAVSGTSWSVPIVAYSSFDDRFYIRDTLAFHLISTDEEFETPAGKFKCYVYKYSRKPADDVSEYWDYYNYYSPGLGLVALVVRGQSDNRIVDKSILYDYRIAR